MLEESPSPGKDPGLLKDIVIVGGGSAGWMTAAALASLLNPQAVRITLVESEQIGTVGVGEATIPDIINFNRLLGISEADFLAATNGTFKLGIEFVDWSRKGETYFHPFGVHGADMQGIDFHQYWMRARGADDASRLEDYSLCARAAADHKFVTPDPNPRSVLSQIRYAYHFDAVGYAAFLREYAEARGVRRVEGKVGEITQDPDSGFIRSVTMENGDAIAGDLFFDCTGFRGLLIEKTLGVGYRDWSHWLACDTAQAVPCEANGPLLAHTRATAKTAGWQWRIPTQHRTGNGHIYSSAFLDHDAAAQSLMADIDGAPLADPRMIRFKTGHREAFWSKNCIAVGLSAGFLEPLESTSLYLIQEGISKFISLFPSAKMSKVVRAEYNRQLTKKFEQVRDFIILHYVATERDDTPFWNYCRTMDIPDSLKARIELFREAGRVFRYEDELFSVTSWVAVLIGQNIHPRVTDPIVQTLPLQDIQRSLDSMRTAMDRAVAQMPTHDMFLKRLVGGQARPAAAVQGA